MFINNTTITGETNAVAATHKTPTPPKLSHECKQSFPLAMYMPMHTKCCQEATAKFNNAVKYL